jgi:divalent metal cation (Fe/Co/Zn/Cd) transporter
MEILTIILIVVFGIALVGGFAGAIVYYNKFKAISQKFKEFSKVILDAVSDKKLSDIEKANILTKVEELTPMVKELLADISKDAGELDTNFSNFVEKLKAILAKKK